MRKHETTIQKRFKILYLLVLNLPEMDKLLKKLELLSKQIELGNPQAAEALCYYEDNILSILSEGMEVKELN